MKEKVRVGLVGIGGRGGFWLDQLLNMEDVEVNAVCDLFEDRTDAAAEKCKEKYGREIFKSTDYKDIVVREDIDAVIATTYWNDHIKVAIAAMKNHKYAAMEVGPAQSIRQCWDLVRTSEETGMPCMILENCCYDKNEMTVLNMIKKGIFGEVTHVEGGYEHDLRHCCSIHNNIHVHERRWQDMHRNGELYPTHELGPMMKYLSINRGNRLLTLTSMSSKALGLEKYAREHLDPQDPNYGLKFSLGDVITTMIKTANGETMLLTHQTATPRPYSRGGRVDGTNGIWMEDKDAAYIEGRHEGEAWEPMSAFHEEYGHPLWKKTCAGTYTGGHGGMDWIVMRAFINAVKNEIDVPIDVYDAATMMCVAILSEESIALGGMPVAIPDFTDGEWVDRNPAPKTIFSLEEVDESLFPEFLESI